jgi:adenylate cyclase 9
MVGAMGTRRLSTNIVPREKWSLKSLFYPQFDSSTIEKKYILSYLKKIYPSSHRLLVIILISHALINSIELFIFNTLTKKTKIIHLILLAISICLNILSLIIINRLRNKILSNVISFICLCPLAILSCIYPSECHLYLLIVLIYTLANLSLFLSILISILITIIITVLTLETKTCLILVLISNMIGIYLNRLLDITMRSAYNQLCKSKFYLKLKIKRNFVFFLIKIDANVSGSLLNEHTLISKMIDSLMPRKYSKVIMEDFDVFRERVQNINMSRQNEDDLQMTVFRPLHIERMENVSILFADIVGFTHMSSNKSAAQLVSLLSDLYGRFDNLCVQMACEKIATLGDCYYCVSGCPEPREDHARACVLMGLAMINAIEEFDEDNDEKVDMRVGVHSGSVNCGIVGTRKFKFDIFSNDVTLANKMESTGKPGKLYIKSKIFSFYLFILKGGFFF